MDRRQAESGALVIGAGPAGLMAAEAMAGAGLPVTVAEAKASAARKLLMAGKSGLNLTRAEPLQKFVTAYGDRAGDLRPMLAAFGPDEVRGWAEGLGQPLFAGSTGRVFPRAMKASPLLRAWLARLGARGVTIRTRWRWRGWDGGAVVFETPEGVRRLSPAVLIQQPHEVLVPRMAEIRMHPDDRDSALLLLLRQRWTCEPTPIISWRRGGSGT